MDQKIKDFFHDFRQEMLAGAEANSTYQLETFMEVVSNELIETGFVEGFEHCHYRSPRGMRVDGYWFDDEGSLDIFVADFDCRRELATLTRTEIEATFKRAVKFVEASLKRTLEPDVTTPEYGLVQQIFSRHSTLRQINFYLTSERALSTRFQTLAENEIVGIRATYHVWDITRFQRQRSSRSGKEALNIDFYEIFGHGINCLPADLGSNCYRSYLIVMPARILAYLYDRHGARLLEQNVRTFLQARAEVNKGIRATILNEPHMFFSYNNGITATAQQVETELTAHGLQIIRMTDLQIVNGGQTTASLFHTQRRDKADLSDIFVQMKLSVINDEQSGIIVPKISEYANTQNRVNAADFFSNHPFHIRMEDFSRRIWAPAQKGAQRETKWFYERARGQYLDAQSKFTLGDQKRFKAEYPKPQMFTKTDLAKFENVFDDHPKWVNLGSQKNFSRYATRIGKQWEKSPDDFNENYFRRAVARGILFRTTEKIVSLQPWYDGGYRANIVAYTLSMLGEIAKRRNAVLSHQNIWHNQSIDGLMTQSIVVIAKVIMEEITRPPVGISNVTEWCKKEACWTRIIERTDMIIDLLPNDISPVFTSVENHMEEVDAARKTQKIDNGIEAQKRVFNVPTEDWCKIMTIESMRKTLSDKEIGALKIAKQIPAKIPTEKQSLILLGIHSKAQQDGII